MNKMIFTSLVLSAIAISTNSCSKPETKEKTGVNSTGETIQMDSLLHSPEFALSIASFQDSSYYAGIGQPAPAFLAPGDDTASLQKDPRQEQAAISLAGFYALECGLGYLCDQTNETPTTWLQKIVARSIDSAASLVLNRFANATWKAGQPFRSLSRISRQNFINASSLSVKENEKDAVQIRTAAQKLLSSLKPVTGKAMDEQMVEIRRLLHDTNYAYSMAAYLDSSYNESQNLAVKKTDAKEKKPLVKSVREMKIATSIAGFYATECASNYLATLRHSNQAEILESLVADSISKEDKLIFARFANATWKAGQPFRGLERIGRETFSPFFFLNEADIEKDLVQIRAAARKILSALNTK